MVSAGCGRDAEVVIDGDTQDITVPVKTYEKLSTSTASKFSLDDLTVGELKYFMTESEIQDILGEPLEIEDLSDKNKEMGIPEEKVYHYNSRILTFSNIDILNSYYRDEDCMNNPYMSADRTIIYGKFLYGSFTMDSFDSIKYKNKVQYGIINFNGNQDLESASNYMVEFTYFEPPYIEETVSVYDDYAQILFEMDNSNKITSISWKYYPEEIY